MEKKKETDSYKDYKSVLKEYDFYNNNDNDFEIIEECTNTHNNISNNETKNEIINQNFKFENFIINTFRIIFNARNQGSEFGSSSKSTEKISNNSFQIDFEELIEYENLKTSNYNNEKKKYFIDFYLIKNKNEQDNNSLKSVKVNNKEKLLVERWKIKYKEKIRVNDIKEFTLYLNKKLKIIEKSIIEYSHILPLFNISKNEKFSIEFKFCDKNKKKFLDKNSTQKIQLINDNMFNFKLSIKYLRINQENIEIFLKKNSSDFVIIESAKTRKRFLSDSFRKKSSSQLLNNLEKNNNEKNVDNYNNNFIKENYIDYRRLSYNNDSNSKNYLNSGIKENNNLDKNEINKSGSICSNEENLSLIIQENDDIIKTPETVHTENKNIAKSGKTSENINIDNNKENTPRKCQTYQKIVNLKTIKSSELSKLDNKNPIIKNILKDYKNVRRMMRMMPDFDNLNHIKLLTFIHNN